MPCSLGSGISKARRRGSRKIEEDVQLYVDGKFEFSRWTEEDVFSRAKLIKWKLKDNCYLPFFVSVASSSGISSNKSSDTRCL